MQYKVPQNVDLPDKVIAGMTLRQFMFLLVAGGIILLMNSILIGPLRFFFWPLTVVVGSLGAAMAFIKVNDRPMEVFLLSVTKTFVYPSMRVWKKDMDVNEKELPSPGVEPYKPKARTAPRKKSELQKLAAMLDSGRGLVEMDNRPNGKSNNIESGLPDVIAEIEKPSSEIENLMKKANKKIIKHRELPVSSLASIRTTPEDFNYQAIEVKKKNDTDEFINKAKQGSGDFNWR